MIELFTTIPARPKRPNIDRMVRSMPSSQWPKIAPASPSGIADITTSGQLHDENDHTSTR